MNDLGQYIKAHPPQGFKPLPVLNETGNMPEWYWSDDPGWAEAVNHDGVWVGSILRSFKTGRVVGVKIFLEAVANARASQARDE